MAMYLRRKEDGLYLEKGTEFPQEHNFSERWVIERVSQGEAELGQEYVTLKLMNGVAKYEITGQTGDEIRCVLSEKGVSDG